MTTSSAGGVYLYPNPGFRSREPQLVQVLPPYGFVTGGGSLIQTYLYSRLASMSSGALPQANRASSSDHLFFSFLAPYRPPFIVDWTPEDRSEMNAMGPDRVDYMPNDMRLTLIWMCRQLRNSSYIRSLMPLLRRTSLRTLPNRGARLVRQHFLITPFDSQSCFMEPEFKAPGAPRVPEWIEAVLLHLQFDNLVRDSDVRFTPRTIQLPYMSSVRWDSAWEAHGYRPPWRRWQGDPSGADSPTAISAAAISATAASATAASATAASATAASATAVSATASASPTATAPAERSRAVLVCFTGSLRGLPRSRRLRQTLVLACSKVPNSVCSSLIAETFPTRAAEDPTSEREQTTLRRALRLKRRATFCLEPTGYSPPRKSSIDAWLSGCIPVFFYEPAQYRQLLPWYVGTWAEGASVRLPAQAATNGSVDVIRVLNAIPPGEVRKMQETIAANAHVLVYGTGQRGVVGDAVDRLLHVLRHHAVDCPPASGRAAAGGRWC
jgi:hypothetical protein